ncbi:MAG: urease accessory protein UreE [Gammaproteobacteria bacterium]|nr:urease accessory protein UreE [Gammaproteobacteria bacterium]NNM00103.1 urease accessory protein UreE [Gammaproteobacteria bacterium]
MESRAATTGGTLAATVQLTYDERKKSRARGRDENGAELAWFLERGTVLADGDVLRCVDGALIGVRAAAEPLSVARCDDALLLTRAAYHLGNRHVPLQIAVGELRYQPDHVLDAMLEALGLSVTRATLPFAPESGAYGRQGHAHHDHQEQHEH